MDLGDLFWRASGPWRRMTAGHRPLPNAIIVGAQKAGTTYLFDLLAAHPGVMTSLIKEVHHFDAPGFADLARYRSAFPLRAPSGRVVLEASPYYLHHPAAAERIAAALPEVRLIIILRDPVARAYSHYQHQRRKTSVEPLAFADALAAEEGRLGDAEAVLRRDPAATHWAHRKLSYRTRGCYAAQLARYYASFPRERILVLMSDELFSRPDAALAKACAFLGIATLPPVKRTPSNSGGGYGGLDPAIAAGLRDFYRPHDAALAELLGAVPYWAAPETPPRPA